MTWTFLPKGRYSDGRYALCTNCGREPGSRPKPTGVFVTTDFVVDGHRVEFTVGICSTCILNLASKKKEKVPDVSRQRKGRDRPHRGLQP